MSKTHSNITAKSLLKSSLLFTVGLSTLALATSASAQDAGDEVIVTGIRQSLENALVEKREADSLVEIILAEDIGKLPDQNLAEVLENITGIQITREEGVGTGVQIRGTDENLTLINGVSTVGAGTGRGGISFEDINASIIAGVEVTKAPEAASIEGAVGGTINLRTIRPLDLKDTLANVRIQGEDSNLADGGLQPRISGALGHKWENASGQEIGVVLSGSYTEAINTAFRPRLDRDNVTICGDDAPSTCPDGATHFLGVQFLNQVQRTQEFETINFAGSVEAQVNPNLKIYGDVIYNDQERRLSGSRVQASTVSRLNGNSDRANGDNANFTAFDTFDLGTAEGENGDQNLGTILAVTQGTFTPLGEEFGSDGRGAPFLRVGSDGGSRLTESTTLRFGGEWEKDAWAVRAEYARSDADTVNPNLSVNLNFINPNPGIFNAPSGDGTRDENGTPIIFDLTDGFGFDVNFADPLAPTEADLLNPANYVIDGSPTYSSDIRENSEDALRLDVSYDFEDKGIPFIKSIEAGYRYSNRQSLRDDRDGGTSGSGVLQNSVNASGFTELLNEIPDNFGSATGNALSVSGVLQVNPLFSTDPLATINAINSAAAAQGLSNPFDPTLESVDSAFFDIEEETHAIYGQINFGSELNGIGFRGNVGLRYIDTETESMANLIDLGVVTPQIVESSYDDLLPRVNLIVDATDDIVLRGSYSQDINRPDFDDLAPSRTFPNSGGVNSNSVAGNPLLVPEEVESFDVSAEWYFAPEAVFTLGYFRKERDGLFGDFVDEPATDVNGNRDVIGPVCEDGGIFSAGTEAGIFGNGETGVCVGDQFPFNSDGTTTQQGIETSLQYNLGQFEDRLGWASGFGFIANYTYQTEDNDVGFVPIEFGRAEDIFEAQGLGVVTREAATLLNLSKHAYNLTGYYEKYGLSARLRYTWRDDYATDDLPGTGNVFTPLGFRGQVESRGQLNGSLSYDVNDHLNLSVDAVNITESDEDVSCVPDGGLPCYQVTTDRRVIFGASYTF